MNPLTIMLANAKKSTSPFVAIFTWGCVWVFASEDPTAQVLEFYAKTDPLKLVFGIVLVIGSLFLNARGKVDEIVDLTDEVIQSKDK
jgi:hypothetical protein